MRSPTAAAATFRALTSTVALAAPTIVTARNARDDFSSLVPRDVVDAMNVRELNLDRDGPVKRNDDPLPPRPWFAPPRSSSQPQPQSHAQPPPPPPQQQQPQPNTAGAGRGRPPAQWFGQPGSHAPPPQQQQPQPQPHGAGAGAAGGQPHRP
ncbi:hypothetical protein EIP91_003459 [Steccherinum ochraceum]|uniref:Uncharacterized protein n=1 Tax=Steccherinum ochraceum TaxID=92696 RepID=A0A4R0RDU4_9APHY|nr:hypothetical protein EIP91_003459 [Steccherinum ochraceum]